VGFGRRKGLGSAFPLGRRPHSLESAPCGESPARVKLAAEVSLKAALTVVDGCSSPFAKTLAAPVGFAAVPPPLPLLQLVLYRCFPARWDTPPPVPPPPPPPPSLSVCRCRVYHATFWTQFHRVSGTTPRRLVRSCAPRCPSTVTPHSQFTQRAHKELAVSLAEHKAARCTQLCSCHLQPATTVSTQQAVGLHR